MRLGINIGYWGSGAGLDLDLVLEAERLGYETVWAAEAWGSDTVTILSWIAARTERIRVGSAIMQMPARTPAMTAMTAVTLNELSGGRFVCGLGLSGPQVVEGWHGVAYGKPLGRTREYVAILRSIFAREAPVEHDGYHYQLPYRGDDATGLGKPLRLITHPRHEIPVYLASIGPRNVALTAEIADGWLPVLYSPERAADVFDPWLGEGFAASGDAEKRNRFATVPAATAIITSDAERARRTIKPNLALYIGGMGARDRNFYNSLVCRYGYEAAARQIQDLYLAGKPREAAEAVPDALVDELHLIGPAEAVRDRLAAWKDAGVTELAISSPDVQTLRALPDLL